MIRIRALLAVAALAASGIATPVAAQQRPGAPGAAGQQGQQGQRSRQDLENRVRENFAAEVKKRLQLSDDQMTKLMAVNQRLDAQRRELFQQERAARTSLRTELQAGNAANQARVAEVLETLLRLQRSRLELVEREQRELATFLTPVQRARYQAFVDFLQRRMDDMSDGRGRGDGRGDDRDGARGENRRGDPGAAGTAGRGGGRRPPPPPATPPPVR